MLKIIEQLRAEIERLKAGGDPSKFNDDIIAGLNLDMDPTDIPKEDISGLSIGELQRKFTQLENAS